MIKSYLYDQLTPVSLYAEVLKSFDNEITMLFESVVTSEDGNFSFITIGAQEEIIFKENKTVYKKGDNEEFIQQTPFEFLKHYYASLEKEKYQKIKNELGFSFVDGFIGFIAYDMVKVFEPSLKQLMDSLYDPLNTPDMHLVRPKIIIGFSHKSSVLTIIDSSGAYQEYFRRVEALLQKAHTPIALKKAQLKDKGSFAISTERFKEIVQEAKEHIRAGDVFQMLPSNRYTQEGSVDPLSFYRILRSKNPSPYMFLLNFKEFSICGSSPEVMVRLSEGEILLRPIAGTRKRGKTKQRDLELEKEMLSDPKERAEHLMLIDLGRNDVGRVAKVGTVKVPNMMRVERYSHVMHMVSDVIAQIDETKDMFDLFGATFTAGTMTGAPKVKAMELIAKFEQLKRGFYSGSVGYFSFTGDMDSAIVIRTSLITKDKIVFQAGAGVVADSVPELEELEVRNKLMALMTTLKELETINEEEKILLLKEIE